MNDTNERLLEAAGELEERRRDFEVKRIRQELTLHGDEFCRACGDPIGEARRAALPSATRCVECQATLERMSRR